MGKHHNISHERIREVLNYDGGTGQFYWKVKASKKTVVGSVAGSKEPRGYIKIRIDGALLSAHQIAFMWMNGNWADGEIDHIDRDKSNNRWDNLRLATRSQNARNSPPRFNKTGFNNVGQSASGKYYCRIIVDKKQVNMCGYDTPAEAHNAYLIAVKQHHGEFART